MDAKSKTFKGLLYLFLILLSALCFTPFWLMIVNATRSGNEIMTGFSLLPSGSLAQNWAIVSENMDLGRGFLNSLFLALLARVGLEDKAGSFPRQLSGGQKQRVAIVRALILHPEILLFDEVTAALDPEMVREVLDVVLDLARQGRTMLIVTHEMQFARAVADRVVFIDEGKIVETASPREFFDHPKTARAKKFLNVFSFEDVAGQACS